MSWDAKEGKQNMHASQLRDKLYQKIISAKKAISNHEEESLEYCDFIYLILDKNINLNAIKAFLNELYSSNSDNIHNNWKEKLTDAQILNDIYSIKKKAIE